MANKSEVLNETIIALGVAAIVVALGVIFQYSMTIPVLLVGFVVTVGCIFGIGHVNSSIGRKLMLWFVPSFMVLSMSGRMLVVGGGTVATAAVATVGLVALASVLYNKFSMKSLLIFSLVGLIGLLILMLCGFHGTWISAIGVIVFFGCIMFDFANIEYCDTPEEGALGLVISIVNMFNNLMNLFD